MAIQRPGLLRTNTAPAGALGLSRRSQRGTPDSVLDIFVTAEDRLPWAIPADQYIKEARIGLRDGATPPGPRCWSLLKKCLEASAACGVCEALFWISIMVIFPIAEKEKREGERTLSMDYLRDHLAKSWLPLTLEAKKGKDEFGTQEWVLAGLTHVYAQIIFRLLVDTFSRDKMHIINNGDAMIDKLSQLVHYELTGFQMCVASHRKTRKQLFLGRVIQMPHVNQFEFLKGQKRQEELQSRVDSQLRKPLTFGSVVGDPLDPAQMDHVMDHRSKAQHEATSPTSVNGVPASPLASVSGTSQCWALESSDLSVDNYLFLTQVGQSVFEKQLHILETSGMPDSEVHDDGDDASESQPISPFSVTSNRSSTAWPNSPNSAKHVKHANPSSTWTTGDGKGARHLRKSLSMQPGSMRKSVNAVMFLNRLGGDDQRRQEEAAEAELQKQRDVLINNSINAELPEELRNRELYTTWVSPVAKRLKPGAEDRFMLKKPSAEARHLQMAPPSPIMAGSVQLKRPKSMPASSSKHAQRRPSKDRTGCSSSNSSPKHAQRRPSKDRTGCFATRELEEWSHHGPKDVFLEPPQSISNEKVLERLHTQLETCQEGSFGVYMKNFDILSGQRKQNFCEKRLRNEEAAYVKKMEALVRGTLRRVPTAHGERPQGPPSDGAKFRRSREFVALFSKSDYA